MADTSSASFTGSIPENYDRYLGPAQFAPFAADLAARVADARPHRAVLEVACGTGIVTKELRAQPSSATRIPVRGGYGNVYVTMTQAVLTFRTLLDRRDPRKSLAPVFSRG